MELFDQVRRAFWSEYVWLPPGQNITWHTYRDTSKVQYAQFEDLYYGVFTAIALILIRLALERIVFTPLGLLLGIKIRRRPPASVSKSEAQPVLEQSYRKAGGHIKPKEVLALAKRTDLSERQVQRWLRRRALQDRPSTMQRFTESCWRMSFYAFAFSFGIWTLWDKPWLWDSMECFINYPHHSVSSMEWWYYNIELGFYLALIASQFYDVPHKDFWQMFIHHLVTVALLSFSWACNLHRVGALVLLIHDFADIPLEGAKLSRYTRNEAAGNVIFAFFAVCWIFSRLGLLPYRVIAYSSHYALDVVPIFPAYWIFNALLVCLQVLHVIWTYLILRIAYNAIYADGVKDLRESDESVTEDEEETEVTEEDDIHASALNSSKDKEGHVTSNGGDQSTRPRVAAGNGNNNASRGDKA